ncbi:MAG: hypothetical protein Q8J89_05385 [Caulobacter sp.]|nr:hypothetical protein [Caulobacter sp.]
MKLRMLAAAAILSLSFAGVAQADSKAVATATLKAPVAAKTKVVVAGAVYNCEGSTCISLAAPARAVTLAGCKALVKEVGELTAFSNAKRAIEGDDLATCNAAAS